MLSKIVTRQRVSAHCQNQRLGRGWHYTSSSRRGRSCSCIRVSKEIEQHPMGEAISSTNPPQENASGSILQEGNRPPGKYDAACQPKAQGIVLHRSAQPADQPAAQPKAQPDEQ